MVSYGYAFLYIYIYMYTYIVWFRPCCLAPLVCSTSACVVFVKCEFTGEDPHTEDPRQRDKTCFWSTDAKRLHPQ
jgi:hypothetical protein